MKQGRVCDFVGLPCTHRRSFLDLPLAVRQRIYGIAGVPANRRLYIVTLLEPNQNSDDPFSTTFSLLQTCKAVHDDVLAMTISRNTLVLLPSDLEYGLDFLDRLALHHVRLISKLEIRLQIRGRSHSRSCPSRMEETRSLAAVLTASRVKLWQKVAARLFARVPPGVISLRLICDLETTIARDDTHLASLVAQPLLNARPGTVKDCKIRLSLVKMPELSHLATEAACHITGQGIIPAIRKGIFRFSDLPQEIRMSIFEYTDLITPHLSVNWHPELGFYCSSHFSCCRHSNARPESYPNCPFRFCGPKSNLRTFCRGRRSAYNPKCRCWIEPSALMLVSRAVYQDAAAVFYSKNRITVVGQGWGPRKDGYYEPLTTNPLRLDASRFLTRYVWPEVLWHIRTLEFVVPKFESDSHPSGIDDPAYHDWQLATKHLATYANLASLTLIIHMSTLGEDTYEDSAKLREAQLQMERMEPVPDAVDLMTAPNFELLLQPLGLALGGRIRRFFVHLEAAWHYSSTCNCMSRDRSPQAADTSMLCRVLRLRERNLEAIVMGSEYNNNTVGKRDEGSPQWLRCIRNPYDY